MLRASGFKRRSGASSEIPSSSMADIAFLLLIFFMVTTVFRKEKKRRITLCSRRVANVTRTAPAA